MKGSSILSSSTKSSLIIWGRTVSIGRLIIKVQSERVYLSLESMVKNTNDEKSTFTFEDAMAFVGGEVAIAA